VRVNYLKDIRRGLEMIYSPDRIQIVRLNMSFNWDKVTEDKEEYTPIEMEKDNPATPYSERKVVKSFKISERSAPRSISRGTDGTRKGPQAPKATSRPDTRRATTSTRSMTRKKGS
jgi:flagellar biosynthesis/type III secretory pathway M-ring protein FliF/YscJ